MDKHAKAVQASYVYGKEGASSSKKYVATNLPDYHFHESLSDSHSVVLHNPNTNHVIIAYRGTQPNVKDLMADAQIALGLHHVGTIPREAEADAKYHRVATVFPDANVTTAGHSLGGVQSYHVATKNNLEGHHFNMGESPIPGIATANRIAALFHHDDEKYQKQHIYHSDNYKALGHIYHGADPISEGTKGLAGIHHTLKVNATSDLDAHDLRHFISSKLRPEKPKSTTTKTSDLPSHKAIPFEEFMDEEKYRKKKSKQKVKNGRHREEDNRIG